MRHLFLLIAFLSCLLNSYASDYYYMVFETKDDVRMNVVLKDVKVVFDGAHISIVNEDQQWQYDTSKVKRFYFVDKETMSVEEVLNDAEYGTAVYDVDGRLMGRFSSQKSMEEALPRGIYIIKSHDEIFKRVIK